MSAHDRVVLVTRELLKRRRELTPEQLKELQEAQRRRLGNPAQWFDKN
jgi:hypothetical protein